MWMLCKWWKVWAWEWYYTKLLYQVELWTLGGDTHHKVGLLMCTLSFLFKNLEGEWSFLLAPKKTHRTHSVQLKSAVVIFSYIIPWEVTIATGVFWPGTYSTLGSCFCVKKPACFVCILSLVPSSAHPNLCPRYWILLVLFPGLPHFIVEVQQR